MSFVKLTAFHQATRLCLLTWLTLGLGGLMGCSTTQASLTVTVPSSLRDCTATPRPASQGLTVGHLAAFSVMQAADLEKCRTKNAALIEIIESVNKANAQKKPWWRLGN